jgi:zona occludens toxin
MINLLLGRPGGGKSYEAVVYHIIPAIKAGRLVVTNLPLNLDVFEAAFPGASKLIVIVDALTVKQIRADAGVVTRAIVHPFGMMCDWVGLNDWRDANGVGPLYVVDECHFPMPARGTDKEIPEFLSMHRHYGIDVLLITQHYSKVNRDITNMIQTVYKVSKNFITGFGNSYHRQVYDGIKGNCFSNEKRKYEKKFFPFYKSHTKSNASVVEAKPSDVKPIFFSKLFISIYVLIGLFIIFALSQDWSMDPVRHPEPSSTVSASTNTSSSAPPAPGANIQPTKQAPVSQVQQPPEPRPFDNVDLFISGFAEYTDRGRLVKQIYFEAYKNNALVADLTLSDLILAGYNVSVISDCFVRIKYGDYSAGVMCRKEHSGVDPSTPLPAPIVSVTAAN